MAEVKKAVSHTTESDQVVERAKDFWTRYSRAILIACGAIILVIGGWLGYKYFVKAPKEAKANEAVWKAQQFFELDSMQKALKGDGGVAGFEKVISQYGGTAAGNLANFYAGEAAYKTGDYNKAVKYLKDFSTDAKQVQARAYKVLGDAYANLGKNAEALDNYKKAAHEFEKDDFNSSEYLFFAAFFADRVMNDKKQAIELYKELRKKYPATRYGVDAPKYLAMLGVYETEE
jgi:predicted negative regulator of RcsB-dependent stress response